MIDSVVLEAPLARFTVAVWSALGERYGEQFSTSVDFQSLIREQDSTIRKAYEAFALSEFSGGYTQYLNYESLDRLGFSEEIISFMRNADDGGYLSYILLDSANIIRDGNFTLEGRSAVNLIAESLEIPFLEVFEG